MKVTLHQPNYLPWAGYFARMMDCEAFVFLDNVQFTKQGFGNRVKIVGPGGEQWLTQSVLTKGQGFPLFNEVMFSPPNDWREKHSRTIQIYYGRAPHFHRWFDLLRSALLEAPDGLAAANEHLIRHICDALGIRTRIYRASELGITAPDRTSRLAALIKTIGGTTFVAGPSAFGYLDRSVFAQEGLSVEQARTIFPPYTQGRETFVFPVSIIDTMMHLGPATTEYLASARPPSPQGGMP